jgi:nucleoporin p58/p45
VENLHQYAEAIRIKHLNDLRNSGHWNDPFVEANRKEAAKQEAAARTVHPTLPVSKPSICIAVLTNNISCSQVSKLNFM